MIFINFYLHNSNKSSNFAAQNRRKDTIMAQETLNSLIAVMMTLSVQEQEQVISELQANVRNLSQAPVPYTMEEIDARLDESERDIEEGRYYTTEEVFDPQYSMAL